MACALMLSLLGCGPSVSSPPFAMRVPARFDLAADKAGQPLHPTEWWTVFGDPVLDRIVAAGLKQNLDVQTAKERIVAAQAAVDASRAPEVSTTAGTSLDMSRRQHVPSSSSTNAASDLGGSILVDLFGQKRFARQAAHANLEGSRADSDSTRLRLISAIAGEYIDLRYFQAAQELMRHSVASRRRVADLTGMLQASGGASRLDSVQAQAEVSKALGDLPELAEGERRAGLRIATLLGVLPNAMTETLSPARPQPTPKFDPQVGVPADLIRNRPDIRSAEMRVRAAFARVGVSEAELYPTLRLQGSIGLSQILLAAASGGSTSWSFGPSLNLPIFNRGALKAEVAIAQSEARQAYLQWKGSVIGAVAEVEGALASLARDHDALKAAQAAKANYAQLVDLAQKAYQIGSAPLLNVVQAQNSLRDQELKLAALQRKAASDYVALNVALGAITPEEQKKP